MRRLPRASLLIVLVLLVNIAGAGVAQAKPQATISGLFADSCRDFAAHSSKDISHVEIHFADGRAVKDESTTTPDFAIDGVAGDEIAYTLVKSARTVERFDCVQTNSPPTAVLEVKTPEECETSPDGFTGCDGRLPRTTWSHSSVPSLGHGVVWFFCQWPDDQSCVDHVMPCGQLDFYSLCAVTFQFRGTSSTDPDGDLVSWVLDFGDGTSVSGDWSTNPPTELAHQYQHHHCPTCEFPIATLTVADSAGQSSSDALLVHHIYPD